MLLMAMIDQFRMGLRERKEGKNLAREKSVAREKLTETNRQPWGQLEYTALALDRPDDHFTNDMSNPETTRWTFHHTSPQQLEGLFASIELPDGARKFLLDPAHWESSSDALRITPPPEVIISLGAESRRKLYAVLAESPENVPQRI